MAECNRNKIVNKFDRILELLDSPDPFDPAVKKEVGRLWAESSTEFAQCMGLSKKTIKAHKRRLKKMGL